MSLSAATGSSNRETVPRRPCVLIVDDEESIRSALMRYFARKGWNVCEAEDGDQAARMLSPNAGHWFDLVICDLRMPRVSGTELYRSIVQCRPDLASRFVFSSGDVQASEMVAFINETQRPVLSKPFELCQLARLIDELISPAQAA